MSGAFEATREYLTTPQAEHFSGLTKSYLAKLLRKGSLEGFQLGRDWVIYKDSLDQFLATTRKPGPKGPRRKLI